MKNLFFSLVISLLFFSNYTVAQDANLSFKKGDTFKIAQVENNDYEAIQFPKANFIIKRGGIFSYDRVVNEEVEIHSVDKMDDGTVIATIKRTSRGKFFNSHKYLKVDMEKALERGELVKI